MTRDEILSYLKEIKPIFEVKGIEKLGLFGSFAKNKDSITSDIDIIFKFRNDFFENGDVWEYFNTIEQLKDNISSHFHIKVDTFDNDSISSYKQKILKESLYV